MQSLRFLQRKSRRIYFTPSLFFVIFSTKYVRIFVTYYKVPKMPKIKETLRSIFFIKLTEYHNFSSF